MSSDRMTEEADWKDGMNAFRLKMWEEIAHLHKEINKIKNKLKETP